MANFLFKGSLQPTVRCFQFESLFFRSTSCIAAKIQSTGNSYDSLGMVEIHMLADIIMNVIPPSFSYTTSTPY